MEAKEPSLCFQLDDRGDDRGTGLLSSLFDYVCHFASFLFWDALKVPGT